MPVSPCIDINDDVRTTLLALVWQVLDDALNGKGFQLPPEPEMDALLQPAACFVTLLEDGQLRGCIGSLQAMEPLWINACKNVYASAFNDRRFSPLRLEERDRLSLDISILSPLIPLENQGEGALLTRLVPGVDGLLLEEGARRAVFLPSVWESLPEPELFVNSLKRKGGWPAQYWSKDIILHLFNTEVISDNKH